MKSSRATALSLIPNLALLLVMLFAAEHMVAATYYVGACKVGSYNTIQAAVNAVPVGSTIDVCPGTYAEQVTISTPLTLKAISVGNSSQAIIAVPATGLSTTSSEYFGTVAPQVEVTAGPVNITGITVDGSAGAGNCPSVNYIGIYYGNGSSGTVNDVQVRNQNCLTGPNGVGIAAESTGGSTQTVTVENSNLSNNNLVGIIATCECSQTQPTLNAVITNNYLSNQNSGIVDFNVGGKVSGNVINNNGIGISTTSPFSTVSGNTVIGGAAGIVLFFGGNITVTGNTVNGAGYGIEVETTGTVTSNHITNASSYGIWFDTNGATAKSNTIIQSNVGIELGCNANTVTSNTVNNAQVGISDVPATFNGVNNFYNVTSVSSVCNAR